MTTQLQNTEPLIAFRLAYLRAIARSRQDDAYRRDLLGQRVVVEGTQSGFDRLDVMWIGPAGTAGA